MKIIATIARVIAGIIFVVFGLNAFLHFLKMPPPTGQAGAFMGALFTSGYFYVVAALQIAGGLLLLAGRFVPLGLTLLGPVIVNILLYHFFLNLDGLPLALVVTVLALIVLAHYRAHFAGLLKP